MCAQRDVVLFDLDGTVLDTHDAILESLRYATRVVLGAPLPDEVLVAKVGQPLATQMRTFAPDPEVAEELLRVYRANNEQDLNVHIEPFPGIEQVFSALRAEGFTVGVVTSKRHALAESSLIHFGLRDYLACVNGMEDSAGHKPDPDPLIQVAQDLEVPLDRCLYIGDSPYDLQAARAAGIPSIGVTWGKFFSRAVLEPERPQRLIDSMDELLPAIRDVAANG